MEDTPQKSRNKCQTGLGKAEHTLRLYLVSKRVLLSLFCFLSYGRDDAFIITGIAV